MSERRPVTLEIAGQPTTFEPGYTENGKPKTRVVAARFQPIHNHVERNFDSHTERIFDFARLCIYFSGIILPGTHMGKKSWKVASAMEEEFGWNADLQLTDYMDEYIIDRYINLRTQDLQNNASLPEAWVVQ